MSNNAEQASRIVSTEERLMIRDYILLPYMETMIQKSMSDMESMSNVLKRLYLMTAQKLLDRIANDLRGLRGELKKRNIKVLAEDQEDFIIYHRFYCRGYEERFGMTRDVMRSEISVRLTKYTAEFAALMRNE